MTRGVDGEQLTEVSTQDHLVLKGRHGQTLPGGRSWRI